MSIRRLVLGGAAATASAALMLPSAPASAQAGTPVRAHASAVQEAPGKVAKKLFAAWGARDRRAAARVATPSAVRSIFSYPYRTPDEFAGCSGNVCRFVHTSVNVPGGLDGFLMVVSGSKVTKVYRSRHLTTPSAAARHLFTAMRRNDRHLALEIAGTSVVNRLFRVKYDKRVVYHDQGCSPEPKGYACAYSYEGGALFMHVHGSKTTGYEVRSVSYVAD
ncbi:hypothetical protein ACFOWE_25720 [Planomonospora corallina]|uniref:Tat pathway signal sequence domain protein n=1 Tax=Planomonospora corallina TaxID=1806052 RepID=A0ABV8ICN3_9ACTN